MRLHPIGLSVTLALGLLVAPLTATAQPPRQVPRIAVLTLASREARSFRPAQPSPSIQGEGWDHKALRHASPRPPYRGTMGSVIGEGYGALCRMVCNAVCVRRPRQSAACVGVPVEAGDVAAGDFPPDPMPRLED